MDAANGRPRKVMDRGEKRVVKLVPPPPLPLCLGSVPVAVAALHKHLLRGSPSCLQRVAAVGLQQTVDADTTVLSLHR